MKIWGAGIAGLLAGCHFPTAEIFEAGPENSTNHKALLRFRSSAVGDSVGIEFRKVRVHKGIYFEGQHVAPSILLANLYSQKVLGKLVDRSIWNLDPVDRFIAPEDLIEQLIDRCAGRIHWNSYIGKEDLEFAKKDGQQIISTLPVKLIRRLVDFDQGHDQPIFESAPITVSRYRITSSDVFQTIYFPSPALSVYRASITGDLLIIEHVGDNLAQEQLEDSAWSVALAFGLHAKELACIETVKQNFGKIAPIDDAWRKKFIFDLTTHYNIFSLGRFGTWRNILLDDVIKDISVIKKLMNASSYERRRHDAK